MPNPDTKTGDETMTQTDLQTTVESYRQLGYGIYRRITGSSNPSEVARLRTLHPTISEYGSSPHARGTYFFNLPEFISQKRAQEFYQMKEFSWLDVNRSGHRLFARHLQA